MDKYRFDDAYEKVFELDRDYYVFIGTYRSFGIDPEMSDTQKSDIVGYEMAMQQNNLTYPGKLGL